MDISDIDGTLPCYNKVIQNKKIAQIYHKLCNGFLITYSHLKLLMILLTIN